MLASDQGISSQQAVPPYFLFLPGEYWKAYRNILVYFGNILLFFIRENVHYDAIELQMITLPNLFLRQKLNSLANS